MSRIVFIESNTTGTGGVLLEKALARGLEVHFLSQNSERYPFLAHNWVMPTIVDTSDIEKLEPFVAGLAPDAILSTSEYYLETVATLAARLGLHGTDPAAIALCRDKSHLAETLRKAEVSIPRTVIVTSIDELLRVDEILNFPVVAKPAQGSGSIGVRLCRDAHELAEHARSLLAITHNERGLAVNPAVVVQQYLGGDEYSVEVMGTARGFEVLGITHKYLGAPPHFLEIGHDFPAQLAREQEASLREVALAGLQAAGLTSGPAHVELRFHEGRAHLIEINPRLAGGMIPVLMEQATGIDPLECLLDIALTGETTISANRRRGASIRFLVPRRGGLLSELPKTELLLQQPGITQAMVTKAIGAHVPLSGDFRDRIGWVISDGATIAESARLADAALEHAAWSIAEGAGDVARFNEGTRARLHDRALAIVRQVPSREARMRDLAQLVAMDRAHLVMLVQQALIPAESAQTLLRAIDELEDDDFATLIEQQAPRGTYLLYEDALIGKCGLDLGGSIHLGRSRNDMNAAQFKMRLRDPFEQTNGALWQLRQSLLRSAERFAHVAMPVYSQYQPGLPGTYGFYLAGVAEALSRDQQALLHQIDALNTSPLGSGAGAGTTLPIDGQRVAGLLGFEHTNNHALDGVASRDLALRMLASLATTGVTLSRCLQDLQLWTTREFDYLHVPDNLTGGSSMMPQKRNPYLLEMAQGKAAAALAASMEAHQGMLKTPFSNSVQVGTESLKPVHRGFESIREAAILTELFVAGATPNQAAMAAGLERGEVMTTAMAEAIAASGAMSFREAHNRLGQTVLAARETGTPAGEALRAAYPEYADTYPADVTRWPEHFAHGGGPLQLPQQLEQARIRLGEDGTLMRRTISAWRLADQHLRDHVTALLRQP